MVMVVGRVHQLSLARPVGPGTSVFIPGNAAHSCENMGEEDLHFAYVYAANSFEEVEYVFDK
jgi:oxalate decarboxylase/phosphoglucose isomerase-like protein (cupin superfamily)